MDTDDIQAAAFCGFWCFYFIKLILFQNIFRYNWISRAAPVVVHCGTPVINKKRGDRRRRIILNVWSITKVATWVLNITHPFIYPASPGNHVILLHGPWRTTGKDVSTKQWSNPGPFVGDSRALTDIPQCKHESRKTMKNEGKKSKVKNLKNRKKKTQGEEKQEV